MSREILSMYGRDAHGATVQKPRATCGGCEYPAKELAYSTPAGPKGQYAGKAAGTNHGNKVNQGRH